MPWWNSWQSHFWGLGWSFWEEGRIKISTWANSGIIEPSNFTCKMQSQLCSCPCTSNPRAVQCEPRIQHWKLCSWDMARPSRREIFQVGLVMDQNKVTHVLKSVEFHLGYIWPNPWEHMACLIVFFRRGWKMGIVLALHTWEHQTPEVGKDIGNQSAFSPLLLSIGCVEGRSFLLLLQGQRKGKWQFWENIASVAVFLLQFWWLHSHLQWHLQLCSEH